MQFLSFSFLALFTLCFFLYYAVKAVPWPHTTGNQLYFHRMVLSAFPVDGSSGSTVHLLLGTMDGKQGKAGKRPNPSISQESSP